MNKTARRPSSDPTQERLRQNKALWNKEVSAFVNDLIHFKKMMNGWPSKFFKERSRIVDPIPADPNTVIGSLAGDFQDIVNRGNNIIQEQINYSKNRRQKQPKQMNLPLGQQAPATSEAPKTPEAPKLDLSQQLSLPAAAFINYDLIKLASSLEDKYLLETTASNPFSRFFTKLLNPQFGFGESARIRRLRMTMLDSCVKAYKDLKKLQNEIVKSSDASVITAHKLMTSTWNHWNPVNRLFSTFKIMKPKSTTNGIDVAPTEKETDEVGQQEVESSPTDLPLFKMDKAKNIITDYVNFGKLFGTAKAAGLSELDALVDKIRVTPKNYKIDVINNSNLEQIYNKVIGELNLELGTSGTSFKDISEQMSKKNLPLPPTPELASEAQLGRWLGKTRHQILPGRTSGSRLEVYRIIHKTKKDLNDVMNLLEKGFDETKLEQAISQVNREMSTLRTMVRSLYYSEKPEEIPTSPFF